MNSYPLPQISSIPKDYQEYKSLLDRNLTRENILTNKKKSIPLFPAAFERGAFYRAILYSTNKQRSDKIFNKLFEIKTKSLVCHPGGLFAQGNLMIVGINPGQSGLPVKKGYLKPTFIYYRTGFVMRKAAENLFSYPPYFTNFLKRSIPGNKVTKKQLQKDLDIFKLECDLLDPYKIIALGKQVYDILVDLGFNSDGIVQKVSHPAWVARWGKMNITAFQKEISKCFKIQERERLFYY